jgi:hypothetical protein
MGDDARSGEARGVITRLEHLAVEPTLTMRMNQSRRLLRRLQDTPQGGAWVADCLSSLDAAAAALRRAPRCPRVAEVAWMAVHQVRQTLCLHDDRPTLIEIAHEVWSDLSDHSAPMYLRRADIQRLLAELVRAEGEPSVLQRNELYSLAIVAAAQRETDWHRANHLVQRRFRSAMAVIVLLLILVVALPLALEHIAVGQGFWAAAYSWARESACIVAVLTCGALGGLLSVLLGREQLQISSVEHHILVATYRLRPVIGAASALVFFVLWESGVLQMADAGHRRAGYVSGTLLLMAVVAGFSERLLVGQIEKLSAAFQRAMGRGDGGEERPQDGGRKDPSQHANQVPPRAAESPAGA